MREALESVSAQTRPPIELIVVDDLGDPETRELIDGLGSSSPQPYTLRYVRNPDRGPSSSRNLGVREATAQYVAFLDDDDLWEEPYLERIGELLERTGLRIAVGGHKRVRDRRVVDEGVMPDAVSPETIYSRANPGVRSSNMVIARDLFLGVGGFDEHLPRAEDKDLFFRLLRAGHRYAVLQDTHVVYRLHSGPRITQDHSLRWPFYRKHRREVPREARRRLARRILNQERRQAHTLSDRLKVWVHTVRYRPLSACGAPLRRAKGALATLGGRTRKLE